MKVKVQLFGTLGQDFPGYDSLKGMDVNIPDDAGIKELLAHLDILETKGLMITMDNVVAKQTDKLINKGTLQIFQALAGG